MPLIACHECGKEISDTAPACIHCGHQRTNSVPRSGSGLSTFGWVLLFGGILGLLASLSMSTTVQTHARIDNDVFVPAAEIHNLSLADRRQSYLTVSALILVSGLILIGVAAAKRN
jgi:hypothetical protein